MALEPINCTAHARDIEDVYQRIVRDSDPDTTWMIISPNSSKEYEPELTGSDFEEFLDSFDETKVQYGFARIIPPGSDVGKNILIGWCPDSAAMKSRASFAANFGTVANSVLQGYHVQVSARDSDDLDKKDILKKVSDAAGARYSIQSTSSESSKPRSSYTAKPASIFEKPKPAAAPKPAQKPKVATPPPSAAKPAAAGNDDDDWDEPEVEERDLSSNPLKPNQSTYKPIGKVDLQKVIAEEKAKEDPRLISNSVGGTKPPVNMSSPVDNSKDKLVKGFKTEKSPAELWAERKAASAGSSSAPKKELVQDQEDSAEQEDVNELKSKFEKLSSNAEPQVITPKTTSKPQPIVDTPTPKMNIKDIGTPLPGMHNEIPDEVEEENDDDWDDEKEEEEAKPSLPIRHVEPEPEPEPEQEQEEEEEEEAPPSLPSRSNAPEPQEEEEEEEEAPSLPSRNTAAPPPPPRKSATPEKTAMPSAIAEYDYDAAEDNELTFTEGAKIINIEFVDDDWWLGEIEGSGEKGLFPSNYVSLEN